MTAPAGRRTALAELRATLTAVAACQAVGAVGAVATVPATRRWLPSLNLPRWQPPGAVFGPVWTVLYTLMGVSLRLVRKAPASPQRDRATRLFAVQLALNGLWSFLFFGLRSPAAGLLDVLPLLAAVAMTVRAMWSVSRPAALLLVPYLSWVAFATALTAEIWRRNR